MLDSHDSYDTRLAKQKASVKWLLSKAYNNQIPEHLIEPFYRDHENQEFLKPQIVRSLANAEYYCSALGNIYSDPNYHQLNHSTILAILARKVTSFSQAFQENQITETILIQTNPLKIKAHMIVIEAIMVLYAKEIVTAERVTAAIERFDHTNKVAEIGPMPHDSVQLIFLWLNYANSALKKRIDTYNEDSSSKPSISLPYVKDLKDLCDGISIAALISFYCPDMLSWSAIKSSSLPTISDSIYNLELVFRFCNENVSFHIFHMLPEDITYMRGSLQYNLIAFLADLFNVLELHPVKCVRYSHADKLTTVLNTHEPNFRRSFVHTQNITPIPDLRPSINQPKPTNAFQVTKNLPVQMTIKNKTKSVSDFSEDSLLHANEFVVHKSRALPTLSALMSNGNGSGNGTANGISDNSSTKSTSASDKSDDASTMVAAGKPTARNNNNIGFNTITGRSRSRRNSTTDESQLTIENFCGSQDNINLIGRNPDKEPVSVSRKISLVDSSDFQNSPIRSTLQDTKSSINFTDSNGTETINPKSLQKMKRFLSSEVSMKSRSHSVDRLDGDLSKNSTLRTRTDDFETKAANRTTWLEQSSSATNGFLSSNSDAKSESSSDAKETLENSSDPNLEAVKMQLKEKRRNIVSESRKNEALLGQQRLNLGQTAFFQAINKAKKSAKSGKTKNLIDFGDGIVGAGTKNGDGLNSDCNKDIRSTHTETSVNHEETRSDKYHESIIQMNSSIDELKANIQKIATQQAQLAQEQILTQKMEQLRLQQPQKQVISNSFNHLNRINSHPLIDSSFGSTPHLNNMANYQNQFYLHEPAQQLQQPQPQPQFNNGFYQQPQSQINQFAQKPTHQRKTWSRNLENNVFDPLTHNGNQNSFILNQHHAVDEPEQFAFNSISSSPHKLFAGHKFNTISSRTQPNGGGSTIINLQQMTAPQFEYLQNTVQSTNVQFGHASAVPTPPEADMKPQHISYIGNSNINIPKASSKMNSSPFQSSTYRVETANHRLPLSPDLFQKVLKSSSFAPDSPPSSPQTQMTTLSRATAASGASLKQEQPPASPTSSFSDKGFYISFAAEDQPKKPKPPLRSKKSTNRKAKAMSLVENGLDYLNNNGKDSSYQTSGSQEEGSSVPKSHSSYNSSSEPGADDEDEPTEPTNSKSKPAVANQTDPKQVIVIEAAPKGSVSVDEMERKKERILMESLRRQQKLEMERERRNSEAEKRRLIEMKKEEAKQQLKESRELKRAQILEEYKQKKAMSEDERQRKVFDGAKLGAGVARLRPKSSLKQRPRTIHIDSSDTNGSYADISMAAATHKQKGSTSNISALSYSNSTARRDYFRGSNDSLSVDQSYCQDYMSGNFNACDSRVKYGSYKNIKEIEQLNHKTNKSPSKYGTVADFKGRKSNSLMNLYGSQENNLEIANSISRQNSRRVVGPMSSMSRTLSSPCGPGSLPPGLIAKRRNHFDDTASDISSTHSSFMDYTGPRIYKQPNQKSNKSLILNAIEYSVFPGDVNKENKQRVMYEIGRTDAKNFLILFRDAGCQFRALYSYFPDTGEVYKIYGVGPKQVNDQMLDKFYKYNSGGKCFSPIYTKHLSATIDAFTIHNSLWQSKKNSLSSKRDMSLLV